jgi:hypothetical protein
MKKIITLAFLLSAFCSVAQQAGVYYTFLNGGTNNVLGASTNIYGVTMTNINGLTTNVFVNPTLVVACAEHPNFGVQVSYSCASATATNGAIVLHQFRSFDNGNTFESKFYALQTNNFPTWQEAAAAGSPAGFTNRTACFDITNANATHIGFTLENTHATLLVSNVTVSYVLPSTRVYEQSALPY